jgi:hypothetical protein
MPAGRPAARLVGIASKGLRAAGHGAARAPRSEMGSSDARDQGQRPAGSCWSLPLLSNRKENLMQDRLRRSAEKTDASRERLAAAVRRGDVPARALRRADDKASRTADQQRRGGRR